MKKKILILGGMNFSCEIVNVAHKLNMEVFVTDYYADSPAKFLADHSFMVSATDVDGVVQLIKDYSIDGVIFGYADVLMSSYVDICTKAGLPCYTTHELNKLTLDKRYFKNKCLEYNIPIVPEYNYDDALDGNICYPVLVKPTDNSGARGIYICKDKKDLIEAYEQSLSYSRNKKVLIEHYSTAPEATAFYYIHEGNVMLLGFADRFMLRYDSNNLPLPIGYTFPSAKYETLKDELQNNIPKMFQQEGAREGFIFVQGFIEEDLFVPYEMGYRFTASLEQHLFEKIYGFNHMAEILKFAVGDSVNNQSIELIDASIGHYANVTLLLNKGTITKYIGLEEISNHPNVIHTFVSYPLGTEISDQQYGKLSQVGIRVLLYADNMTELANLMDCVKDTICVQNEAGENMLIKNYSYNCC